MLLMVWINVGFFALIGGGVMLLGHGKSCVLAIG
jgi:hypothetical protein